MSFNINSLWSEGITASRILVHNEQVMAWRHQAALPEPMPKYRQLDALEKIYIKLIPKYIF